MNRRDLQKISEVRFQEARILLEAGLYSGAYYLIGYAVECALKACVAKQIKEYDFPDKNLVNKAYTHDLEKLVGVAGLETDFEKDQAANHSLKLNWAIIKNWSEHARYDVDKTESEAKDIFKACAGDNGMLGWVKARW